MIEVEIKLPLFRRSVTERTLTEFGFEPGNLVKESDFYFTSDFHDFMKTDEALRIRTCDNFNTRETASFLTYKGAKLDTVSTTRKELETRIDTLEEKENALQSIEALLLDMGSSLRETTRKSYLAMLLSKGSPD